MLARKGRFLPKWARLAFFAGMSLSVVFVTFTEAGDRFLHRRKWCFRYLMFFAVTFRSVALFSFDRGGGGTGRGEKFLISQYRSLPQHLWNLLLGVGRFCFFLTGCNFSGVLCMNTR